MAKKPEAALTPQPPAGRLPFDQVVGVGGTRDTPPLKVTSSTPNAPTGTFDTATFDTAVFQTEEQLPPRVSNAVMDGIGAPPSAGAAPSEIRLEASTAAAFAGAGGLAANSDVVPGGSSRGIAQARAISFRDNVERAEILSRALAVAVREEIERLKHERRNDPEFTDFLEFVATTLDQIGEAISQSRSAATPEDQEQELAEAETLAGSLAKAARDFAERNYERIIDYGGFSLFAILGTQLFASMFGVSYEEALATQIALLGLSAIKK
jgi:hypothetical protein